MLPYDYHSLSEVLGTGNIGKTHHLGITPSPIQKVAKLPSSKLEMKTKIQLFGITCYSNAINTCVEIQLNSGMQLKI